VLPDVPNPERWRLLEDFFQAACDLTATERTAFLDRACGSDSSMRAEVESLLASADQTAGFIQQPVSDTARNFSRSFPFRGKRIGPYELCDLIGEGGMGQVYLARRADNAYSQQVALKFMRADFGRDHEMHVRFRVERQILANLNHPNVARLFDGGVTPEGLPWLALEYVGGVPIDEYCRRGRLSLPARLELFRTVCSAIEYAHRNLVIHRDIKPTNVLVTSEGVPKLLDFGIAKLLAPEFADSPRTRASERLMTPEYASPEQVRGEPVTTATDVYGLGVLLYELLAGRRPFRIKTDNPLEIAQAICEETPPSPSAACATDPCVAGLDPLRLKGDLDRIVLMAMEKDPARRYVSADDLDQDLRRFLERRPVRARRSTIIYRLSKFVARHKTVSLMAGATTSVLAALLLLFSLQSRAADARLKRVETLADSAISDMTPKFQQSSASVELQASVFHSTLTYLDQLRHDSGNDPRLLLKLSKAYGRVGDIEGSPGAASLGNTRNAIASYQEALRTAIAARNLLPGKESLQAVIEAYQQLGQIEFVSNNLWAAREHYQQSLLLARKLSGQMPADAEHNRLLAVNYFGLGHVQLNSFETDKAVESLRTGLRVLGADPNGNEDHDRSVAAFYGSLALALSELGDNRDAIATQKRGIAIAEDLARHFPTRRVRRSLFSLYNNMVAILVGREILNAGEVREAPLYSRKSVALAEQLAAGDTTNVQARHDLAFAYVRMGDSLLTTNPTEAHQWYRKSIALTKQLGTRSGALRALADQDETLAALLTKAQASERVRLFQEANRIRQEIAEASPESALDRLHLMRSYCRLSDAELAMSNLAGAGRYVNSVIPFFSEFKLTSPSLMVLRDLGLCYETLGNVRRKARVIEESRQWHSKSLDIWNEWRRRGAATPGSEVERRKVQRLLQAE
jgi:serine/threonine protein kinase